MKTANEEKEEDYLACELIPLINFLSQRELNS